MMRVFSWREAIQVSSLQATTRHVLLNLSIYMNDKGNGCFPSVETQASDTGLSKRAIITHLQLAQDAGFLVKRQHGFGNRGWKRNEYFPAYPAGAALPEHQDGGERNAPPISDQAGAPDAGGGEPNNTNAVNEVHHNNPSNKPKNNPSKKSIKKTIEQWEKEIGTQLCIEQMASWVKRKGYEPEKIKKLIEQFRLKMQANGTPYANFVAAFQDYLDRGFLSLTPEQCLPFNNAGVAGNPTFSEKGLSL
jgi:hypothetical protein